MFIQYFMDTHTHTHGHSLTHTHIYGKMQFVGIDEAQQALTILKDVSL